MSTLLDVIADVVGIYGLGLMILAGWIYASSINPRTEASDKPDAYQLKLAWELLKWGLGFFLLGLILNYLFS